MIKWKKENTYYTHHLWETVITKVIKHSVKGSADSFSLLPRFVSNKGRLLIFVTFKFIIYYSKGRKDTLYFHKKLWSCPIFQSCRRTETLCYGIAPFMHYGYGDFTVQSNSSHLSRWHRHWMMLSEMQQLSRLTNTHPLWRQKDQWESGRSTPNAITVFRAGICPSCPKVFSSISMV